MELSTKTLGVSRRSWLRQLLGDWDQIQLLISLVVLALIGVVSLFVESPYYMGIMVLTTLYIFTGISWNIVAGFSGQLVIAHIIFLAVGAYTTVVLNNTYGITPWVGILAGGVVAGLLGRVVAFIALRYGLKMDYFALFTIALMVAMKTFFLKWEYVGGAVGMGLSLRDAGFSKMIFSSKEPYLYIILVLTTIGVLVQYFIYQSKMGKYFIAIREDEAAASALGVNTSHYNTLALVIGAAMAGVGGGFYMMYVTYIEPPQVFDLGLNVEIMMAAPIIGGLGSLAGPVLGGILNKPLAEFVRGTLSGGRSGMTLIVYGSFLILVVLLMPRGVTGVLHKAFLKLQRRVTRTNE
ncbi:branched-chain amino acid ABC transporter permease [Aggregatilinea lenta]|uniref:branched-chain amino acid ABC transporter permease n=1 Tax=Aggregatilinea lenta TaxID=913108 RepID=UPI000E5B2228|nr:branched-chain amino acid ABC transporter permease [Aggregatilinea lenta]